MSNKLTVKQPTSEAEQVLIAANHVMAGLEYLVKAYEHLYASTTDKDIRKHAAEQIASVLGKEQLLMYPLRRVGIEPAE